MNPAIADSIRKRSLNRFARQVQKSDRLGFNSDRQGQSIDRNRRPPQHAKSPAGGRLLFRARLPPGGREGELPPAVSFQADRSPPYNASGGGRGYGPCLIPAARQEADGGEHGTDLCRSFLRCIFFILSSCQKFSILFMEIPERQIPVQTIHLITIVRPGKKRPAVRRTAGLSCS